MATRLHDGRAEIVRPATLAETLDLLGERPGATVVADGTARGVGATRVAVGVAAALLTRPGQGGTSRTSSPGRSQVEPPG